MPGRRKEPVPVICVKCGTHFTTFAWRTKGLYCSSCQRERKRDNRRAYVTRQKEHNSAEFRRRYNMRRNRWRANHKEQNQASARRRFLANMEDTERRAAYLAYHRAYYWAHREEKNHLARLRYRARQGVAAAIMEVRARHGELEECPRLHVRSASLPCGKRPECFGKVRCEKCPADASPPSHMDAPWAVSARG